MMVLRFFFQKVNFSPTPPLGRRVTGEKIFFPQNFGKKCIKNFSPLIESPIVCLLFLTIKAGGLSYF